ncbi:MAG: hypothetical protein U0232_03380 [Thermomicrobiales bacterium]
MELVLRSRPLRQQLVEGGGADVFRVVQVLAQAVAVLRLQRGEVPLDGRPDLLAVTVLDRRGRWAQAGWSRPLRRWV